MINNTPLVSIALCTYNGALYLHEQLSSLINQTYKNIEIIAVDDCSSDGTRNILAQYAALHSHIKVYYNETNLGFTKNFEKAVNLCSGSYIAMSDQDDIWHHEKISLQMKHIKNNIFIYHDSAFIHQNGSSMNKKMSDIVNLYRGGNPEAFLFFNCVSGHSILMQKKLLQSALPLKNEYFHDWWLAFVATTIGTIDYLPQCLVKYRQHDKSDTNILRLQRKKDKYNYTTAQSLTRSHNWLQYCAQFILKTKNPSAHVVQNIYYAYTQRLNSYLTLPFAKLLYKHRKTLFFIQKKNKLSKLNFIYKQMWGAKTKLIFKK